MTIEEEFQKPVRDRLAEIVIPSGDQSDWQLDVLVPPTDYNAGLAKAKRFQIAQVEFHRTAMNEILHAPDVGVLSGQFPSPRVRRKKR